MKKWVGGVGGGFGYLDYWMVVLVGGGWKGNEVVGSVTSGKINAASSNNPAYLLCAVFPSFLNLLVLVRK